MEYVLNVGTRKIMVLEGDIMDCHELYQKKLDRDDILEFMYHNSNIFKNVDCASVEEIEQVIVCELGEDYVDNILSQYRNDSRYTDVYVSKSEILEDIINRPNQPSNEGNKPFPKKHNNNKQFSKENNHYEEKGFN